MRNFNFDWRWIILIVGLLALTNARRIPSPLLALLLAVGGGYLLYQGWRVWGGGSFGGRPQVKYWRGQRYEVRPQRGAPRLPSLRNITPALGYLLLGGALVASAIVVAL